MSQRDYFEFTPRYCVNTLLNSEAFTKCSAGDLVFEDCEGTQTITVPMDCGSSNKGKGFIAIGDQQFTVYLRKVRARLSKKIWVLKCHCGHKPTRWLYARARAVDGENGEDKISVGCTSCFALISYNARHHLQTSKRIVKDYLNDRSED